MPGDERFKCQELCLCNGLTGKEEENFFRDIVQVLSIGTTPNCFSLSQAYKWSAGGGSPVLQWDGGVSYVDPAQYRAPRQGDRCTTDGTSHPRRTARRRERRRRGHCAGNRLMIAAEREFEEVDEKEEFYRHELGYGKLTRTVVLPDEVDPDNVHAELKDGILKVTLPKIRAAERHTVKVA